MDRTVTDVLTEHRCGINATECDAPGCDWAPDRNLGDWRRQHAEHVAVEIRSAQVAAGLSRVLTDPEREALDRAITTARLHMQRVVDSDHAHKAAAAIAVAALDDLDKIVAVVERLAAAPAPDDVERCPDCGGWGEHLPPYSGKCQTCGGVGAVEAAAPAPEALVDLGAVDAAITRTVHVASEAEEAKTAVRAALGQAATHDSDTARSRFEEFVEDITPGGVAGRPIRMRPKTEDAASEEGRR